MKKLVVLSLVLAVASLANATISFNIDNVKLAAPGVVNVSVLNTFAVAEAPNELWMSVEGPVTFDYASAVGGPAAGTAGTYSISDGGYGAQWLYMAYAGTPAPGSWSNGSQMSINLNYQGPAQATIYLYGPDGVNVVDTATISLVPEPATMALLGLGGLFFARKK